MGCIITAVIHLIQESLSVFDCIISEVILLWCCHNSCLLRLRSQCWIWPCSTGITSWMWSMISAAYVSLSVEGSYWISWFFWRKTRVTRSRKSSISMLRIRFLSRNVLHVTSKEYFRMMQEYIYNGQVIDPYNVLLTSCFHYRNSWSFTETNP